VDGIGKARGIDARYTLHMSSRSGISSALRNIAPRLPAHEFAAVVDHAMDSPGLRVASPENAAWLSLVAYARHTMTEYDELLAQGYDRDSARYFVADDLQDVLAASGVRRKLNPDE
jgi:hypothetical protein